MTKKELDTIVKALQADAPMCDSMAFEIAGNIVGENAGMAKAIELYYRATDAVGWLANRI